MFSLWKILVKTNCSPDFPPIFDFQNFVWKGRSIATRTQCHLVKQVLCKTGLHNKDKFHCNQDAMSSSQAGALQNRLAQQRQVSRSCSFRCDLSQNRRPLAKTQGMSLQTHTADLLLGVPIRIFSVVFPQQKMQKKSEIKIRTKIREGLCHSKCGPQSRGWLTHECRFWCGWDIHINDCLH